jgi:predicted  nucleic acid-binding Zn-ribbon protein
MTDPSDGSSDGAPQAEDLRRELLELDQRIGELTKSIEDLQSDLSTSSGALDVEERAAALTNREELEGILDGLRRRRQTVADRIDG